MAVYHPLKPGQRRHGIRMPFACLSRSLDDEGDEVCHLDAGARVGLNEVQRVDHGSQALTGNLAGAPLLHVRHHFDCP
jgi:hypothetical protein